MTHKPKNNPHIPESCHELWGGGKVTNDRSGRTYRLLCSSIGHCITGSTVYFVSSNPRYDLEHCCRIISRIEGLNVGFTVNQYGRIISWGAGSLIFITERDHEIMLGALSTSLVAFDHSIGLVSDAMARHCERLRVV